MCSFQTKVLTSASERRQANRSRIYSVIAESFRYPTAEFFDQVHSGRYRAALAALFSELPYVFTEWEAPVASTHLPERLGEDLEVEFCRLFDIGPGGPPCPLVEGSYREDRKVVLKELILFYNHFGLSYSEGAQDERPDHLCTEMEFLHYLTFKEVNALQKGVPPDAYRRAQKDFIRRHLAVWIPQAARRVEALCDKAPEDACREALRFYASLLGLTDRFLQKELEYLSTVVSQ